MAKPVEKGGTIAKHFIGGQIRKIGEVAKGNIIPRPDKAPTLIIGQAGSGGPRPHVSIPINTPHGVLSQKKTDSVGSPLRETRQTKGAAILGRNGDSGTQLGAKILDETLRRKGDNLAKVWEELPHDTSIQGTWRRKSQKLGGRETGSPVKPAPPGRAERTQQKEETKPKGQIW